MRTVRLRFLLLAGLAAAGLAAADARAQGVTLFRDRDLEGPRQTFHDDVPDLKYTQIGSHRASSIAVPPGCTAVLYEYPSYHGRSTVFHDNDNNLRNTPVGEDTASSLRVNCRGSYPGWRPEPPEGRPPHGAGGEGAPGSGRRGAILYRDREARGPSAFFDHDVPDLDRTRFGSRMASSIDVSPGCLVTLYELPGYRGRRTDFKERDNNLKNTAVGEDTVSSLRIRCR
jgi:hypothetical protein